MSIAGSAAHWGVTTCCPWRPSRLGVHPPFEIDHPLLRQLFIRDRHCASVLLEGMQEDDEISGSLKEQAVASVREPNPQLTQLSLYLRGNRELRWRGIEGRSFRCSSMKSSIFAPRFSGSASMN
jgi:hypothetical protein